MRDTTRRYIVASSRTKMPSGGTSRSSPSYPIARSVGEALRYVCPGVSTTMRVPAYASHARNAAP